MWLLPFYVYPSPSLKLLTLWTHGKPQAKSAAWPQQKYRTCLSWLKNHSILSVNIGILIHPFFYALLYQKVLQPICQTLPYIGTRWHHIPYTLHYSHLGLKRNLPIWQPCIIWKETNIESNYQALLKSYNHACCDLTGIFLPDIVRKDMEDIMWSLNPNLIVQTMPIYNLPFI